MSPVPRPSISEPQPLQRQIAQLAGEARVLQASRWFRSHEAQLAAWQMEVARIPAPPFGENARGEWLLEKFNSLGLERVHRDAVGNIIGVSAGSEPAAVSVSAHLDTVFPAGTSLNIRQQGKRLYGAGISDNAAGITAMLAVAAALTELELPHAAPMIFIGNVGEEGEGDLRGMRHIFSEPEWKDSIAASVVIDGAGSDTIIAQALGSRRFEILVRGPGGHSWSDFGAPNPIVAISRAIHLFSQTRVSTSPKTTFNVGVIAGGTSVNSIPESASMRVDIRSTSAFEVERLELELRRAIAQAIEEEEDRAGGNGIQYQRANDELKAAVSVIGNRPAGELDENARILQIIRAVDAHLGNSAQIQRASTDANIPISVGREAIALGAGGRGGGAHTLQEWFDPVGRELGLQRILLTLLMLAGAGR